MFEIAVIQLGFIVLLNVESTLRFIINGGVILNGGDFKDFEKLPTPETSGETGSVHPKRSQKAVLQHVKQKNKHFSVAF